MVSVHGRRRRRKSGKLERERKCVFNFLYFVCIGLELWRCSVVESTVEDGLINLMFAGFEFENFSLFIFGKFYNFLLRKRA